MEARGGLLSSYVSVFIVFQYFMVHNEQYFLNLYDIIEEIYDSIMS